MSEYIIDTFGIVQDFANLLGDRTTPLSGAIMDVIASRRREEIVRCKDCRFYEKGDSGYWCKKSITLVPEDSGFCAWGQRR